MQELEKMRTWLRTYPGWQQDWCLSMDTLDGNRVGGGLYPKGMEVTGRSSDILGNLVLRCRYRFTLLMITGTEESASQQVLDFQNWVQQENFLGNCPRFGAGQESMEATEGHKVKSLRPGTAAYQVGLTAQFQKIYEVNENGKN